MGLFEVFRRRSLVGAASPLAGKRTARVMVADARVADLTDPQQAATVIKKTQQWQAAAWEFNGLIGELWFAHNYIGNAMGRVRFFPARRPSLASEPQPMTEDDPLFADATQALLEIMSPLNGAGPVPADAAVMLAIAGDGYLVGKNGAYDAEGKRVTEEAADWCMYSTEQIKGTSGHYTLVEEPGGKPVEIDAATTYVARVWNPDRRFRSLADSPMKPLVQGMVCEELVTLTRMINSQAQSRLNAGLLLIPSELSFVKHDPTTENAGDGDSDDFVEDLIAAMVTPIQEPGSASALVPNVIRGQIDALDAVRLVNLSRQLDPQAQGMRDDLLARIANAIDLPREIVLGLSSSPFSRTAWQIGQETWDAHLEPKALQLAGSFSSGFMIPYLRGLGHAAESLRDVVIDCDPGPLVGQPNEDENAVLAYDRLELSGERLVRALGFDPDKDRPKADEIADRIERSGAMKATTEIPGGSSAASRDADVRALAAGLVQYFESRDEHAGSVVPPFALTAASTSQTSDGGRGAKLGRKLARLDHDLLVGLQRDANGLMFRALERAGASLRRKLGQSAAGRVLAGVPQHLVCATLGRADVIALGFDEDRLLAQAFEPLQERYDAQVAAAQRRTRALAVDAGWDGDDDAETRDDEDRAAGWAVLSGGLLASAQARLFNPDPSIPDLGEADPNVSVKAGTIRMALQRAGGATGPTRDGVIMSRRGDGSERAAGMIGTGERAEERLTAARLELERFEWDYGDPSTRVRPFEPHEALDGGVYAWDDPRLANTVAWPSVEFLFPGDHETCQCVAVPMWVWSDADED